MAVPRYLIGQGEKLSEEIARPPRGMGSTNPALSIKCATKLAQSLAPAWIVLKRDALMPSALPRLRRSDIWMSQPAQQGIVESRRRLNLWRMTEVREFDQLRMRET